MCESGCRYVKFFVLFNFPISLKLFQNKKLNTERKKKKD